MSKRVKVRFVGPLLVIGLAFDEPTHRPYFDITRQGICDVYSSMSDYSTKTKTHEQIYRGAEIKDFDNEYEFELVNIISDNSGFSDMFYVFKIPDDYYLLKLVGNYLIVVKDGIVIEK